MRQCILVTERPATVAVGFNPRSAMTNIVVCRGATIEPSFPPSIVAPRRDERVGIERRGLKPTATLNRRFATELLVVSRLLGCDDSVGDRWPAVSLRSTTG